MENTQYQIVWDSVDQLAWDKLLESVGKSNLLQSWAYGEAKANVEGWNVHRGLILQNERSVAMFQALEKSWPIVGGIVRINRGPLWLHELVPMEEMSKVYTLFRRQWLWWKRSVLLIAPELPRTVEYMSLLAHQGYHQRKGNSWGSAWLDLQKNEEELRRSLKSNWRKKLSGGERIGLEFSVNSSDESFQWLMEQYRSLMSIKHFQGPSIELLKSIREHLLHIDHMLVMQALYEGKPIAGVLIVMHGLACTYLVGWNGADGRKLKAHNFLLWNAALEMKRRGCMWFDLGGVDKDNTSEIATFKLGMGGEEYHLVGEWW